MIYFPKVDKYIKISEISRDSGINQQKLYESIRDMENYNLIKFKRTPLGSYLVEEEEVYFLLEFTYMKNIIKSPRETASIVKGLIENKKKENNEIDMEWAKGLQNAIWRRF